MTWWEHVLCYVGTAVACLYAGVQIGKRQMSNGGAPLMELDSCPHPACHGTQDPRCGSGYCTLHCCNLCHTKGNEKRCVDPSLCMHCGKDFFQHQPGKCLFGPTTYKAQVFR